MPLGPRLRAARHHSARQIVEFGCDRALRALVPLVPVRLHAAAAGSLRARRADVDALRAWGAGCAAVSSPLPSRSILGWAPLPGVYPTSPPLLAERVHYLDGPAAAFVHQGAAEALRDALAHHWSAFRPGRGPAWRPYPTARRSLNLLRAWAVGEARGSLPPGLRRELARHTRAAAGLLRVRIERHSRGNHHVTELVALACLTRVWGGSSAVAATLDRVAAAQFLSGGGHRERSVRYHWDVVADLLDALALCGSGSFPEVRRALPGALTFGRALLHGDGDVGLFNDGALGDTRSPARILALARALGVPSEPPRGTVAFPEEGFVAVRGDGCTLLVDVGPVGADDQPAHAHCDILSFELSDGPVRLVGNRGTAAYSGPGRAGARGTASHSTVQVDDLEQAEMFGDFRVGRRASPQLVSAEEGVVRGRFAWPTAPGVEHERTLRLCGGEPGVLLEVDDRVRCDRPDRRVVARLYLPEAGAVVASGSEITFSAGGRRYAITTRGATASVEACVWHPSPGRSRGGHRVVLQPPPGLDVRFTTRLARLEGA